MWQKLRQLESREPKELFQVRFRWKANSNHVLWNWKYTRSFSYQLFASIFLFVFAFFRLHSELLTAEILKNGSISNSLCFDTGFMVWEVSYCAFSVSIQWNLSKVDTIGTMKWCPLYGSVRFIEITFIRVWPEIYKIGPKSMSALWRVSALWCVHLREIPL